MTTPIIQIKNASLTYSAQIVFAQLSLALNEFSWTAILGPSGVGKTSLLRLIAGLNSVGDVNGQFLTSTNLPLITQVAYMAQTDMLLPWLTVLENATLALKLRGKKNLGCHTNKARQLLDEVGLGAALKFYPKELSGGMRQRVALVRTLLEDKPIVVMDEPFSALDAMTRYQLQTLTRRLLQHKTVLFITHDPFEALRLADTIYLMKSKPANLNLVANLHSPAPRSHDDPEVITMQTMLYKAMAAEKEYLS